MMKWGIYGYNAAMKVQFFQWNTPDSSRPKKVWQVHSQVKVLLTIFCNYEDIVHHEYTPMGQTIIYDYFIESFTICGTHKKDLFPTLGSWKLHHDNATMYSLLLCNSFQPNMTSHQSNKLQTHQTQLCATFSYRKDKSGAHGSMF